MYKKIIKPLWSFDVQKTEKWLSRMSESGYHFVELKRKRRIFVFKKGSPQKITYKIGYDKAQGQLLPRALVEDGWNKIFRSKHWYVMANDTPVNQLKTSVVREGIVNRNKKIFYVYSGVLIYLSIVVLNFFINYMSLQRFPPHIREEIRNLEGTASDSPYWFITYSGVAVAIMLAILSIYSIAKISQTNKDLNEEDNNWVKPEEDVVEGEKQLSMEEEAELKRQGKLIVKRKLAWMYAPDKLEKWLENMEDQGYNLYRVSWSGIGFYFKVGHPRKISYCTDFQGIAKETLMAMHKEMGWSWVYSSYTGLQKWTIWSQEYREGEEKPQLFSDHETKRKHAKKIAVTYSAMFIPLVLIYLHFIWSHITIASDSDYLSVSWFNVFLFAVLIGIFGSFSTRSWLFYRRLRKS
ncbi:DUF2812 domain-containing protein [Evansella tamaricis]|uniref:DUF2812 domain-containing protein n=1 Tax=Evansella tamaricis TaxID=2069301 RepID=A0ABS6JLZ0_9BACI|nr:DUF2812 domain-containing protein [Evansella tamaricis]MBU9714596.1 DUF2812 domain-containing protein [Evansella tamaricis]